VASAIRREISSICKGRARVVAKATRSREITADKVTRPRRSRFRHDGRAQRNRHRADWLDQVGGEILVTEATLMSGKVTDAHRQLGDVMQSRHQAAMSYVQSKAEVRHPEEFTRKTDVRACLKRHRRMGRRRASRGDRARVALTRAGAPGRGDDEVTLRGRSADRRSEGGCAAQASRTYPAKDNEGFSGHSEKCAGHVERLHGQTMDKC
jgi:hypothetical protein